MPSPSPSARRAPIGSTIAILAAMIGLALAGCSHPANNTDNSAESAAASDAGVTAMPTGSSAPNMGNAAASTDSSMMSSTTLSSTPSGGD
jgi:hypothetical protein